jgi:hypothetical protein
MLIHPVDPKRDASRPGDISAMVVVTRDDILVLDSRMVHVPGPVNLRFSFGFPEGKA